MSASGDVFADFGGKGSLDEDKLLSLAKVAETAERYNDMCQFMGELVRKRVASGKHLAVDERNLLSVAYKNVVGAKRASWRTLNVNDDDAKDNQDLLDKYKSLIEAELKGICEEVLSLLQDSLIPQVKGQGDEEEVFYNKMCGDYYRYMSEFLPDGDYPASAEKLYNDALEVAKNLPETHPTRLGLALNFSVCYYEILKKPDKACALAKESFDAAIQKLDTLDDSCYKDSTLIMQLLRDNITLWSSETAEDGAMVEDTED